MPIEYMMLKGTPSVFKACPNCKSKPFEQMMRGMVFKFRWFGLVKKYCAVICWSCKEIVGSEAP